MGEHDNEMGISVSVSDAEEEKQQIDNNNADYQRTAGLARNIGDDAGQRPQGLEVHEFNDPSTNNNANPFLG